MSDGAISQDEIDALLSGVSVDGLNASGHVGNDPTHHFDIPTLQKMADDLQPKTEENINKYTGATFKVDKPYVEQANRDIVLSKIPEVVVGVNADYTTGIKGNHLYIISPEFALKLFALVGGEAAAEVDDMVLSVVSEFIATHIAAEINILDATGKASGLANATPETVNDSKAVIMFPQGDFVLASYPITLESEAFTLWECIGGDAAEGMTKALGGGAEEPAPIGAVDMGGAQMGGMAGGMAGGAQMGGMPNMGMNMGMGMQQPMGGMQMGAMPNMGMGMPMGGMMPNMGMNMGMNVPNVQQLQFPNLQNGVAGGEQGNIGLIMDVFMEMTVELGRTKKSIKDILGMGEGTIIELDKLAGEPVDILVNHKAIAKGEVVVIDENFGVRVTEILSPQERVNELN
ncbi:flagellar motor switch protein FliN [Treponema sp. C6A8]|uniref:flagellar motor switch protein FliN n=1 Tax=Treponema sp. C6A8 TaxID=1410609 RepID=UPI00048285E8|nr:flagellar motor switch protein FliN [Treponema sp. C6A8]